MLTLNSGSAIPLKAGKTLSIDDLAFGKGSTSYAKVKSIDGRLKLTNLSQDLWVVTLPNSPGQWQYAHDDSVPLEENSKITFRKSVSGMVTAQSK